MCGRARKWIIDADAATSSRIKATGKVVPRRRSKRKVHENVSAMMEAENKTTPFSPATRSSQPTSASKSHSQANHGWPALVEENGSAVGMA
jgi:hypothetical protein